MAQDICFYGDVLLSRNIESFAARNGLSSIRAAFAPFLAKDALHVTNLEGTVGSRSECRRNDPLCFPVRSGLLDLLTGFDVVGLENNHALDLGQPALRRTAAELAKKNIHPLGHQTPSVVLETAHGNIGLLGVTDTVNAQGDERRLLMADSPQVLAEIKRLKARCTLVAVYVHWGRELDNLPTAGMKQLAAQFIQAGADLIVGTHPHVFGQVGCIQGRPVVYSLGNFLFDQKYAETKSGAILRCKIEADLKTGFTLRGIEVPENSYLPQPAKKNLFQKENKFLTSCTFGVRPTWTGIFTPDRKLKGLRLIKDAANPSLAHLELFDLQDGKRKLRTPAMPIWKLQPVDIDQDGLSEILLIQYIYSALDNAVAKRVYIYSFNKTFHALWRGSGLSRPLLDAAFVNNPQGMPILIALHTADSFLVQNPQTPQRVLMSYHWNGFGFSGHKERALQTPAVRLSCIKDQIYLIANNDLISEEIPVDFFH